MTLQSLLTLPPWRVLLSHLSSGNLPPPALLHSVSKARASSHWCLSQLGLTFCLCQQPTLPASLLHPACKNHSSGGSKLSAFCLGHPLSHTGPTDIFSQISWGQLCLLKSITAGHAFSCWWDKCCRYQIVIELVLQLVAKCHFTGALVS